MKLNPKLPLSNPFMARIAAQAIVFHMFNMKRVVAELRPDLKTYNSFGGRLLDEPAVRQEIEIIMNRTERNSTKYMKMLWDWLEAPVDDKKETEENRRTAARLLGKAYIDTKGRGTDAPQKPMVIEGLGEGIDNLTSEPKKVM